MNTLTSRPKPELSCPTDMTTESFVVPVVDISPFVSDKDASAEAKNEVARAVASACRTVGFMQITGHGIPEDVLQGMIEALDAFFLQDLDIKKQCASDNNRGYSPPNSENLSLSLGVEATYGANDFFEAFNIGTQTSDYPELELSESVYQPNVWPSSEGEHVPERMRQFRPNLERWFKAAAQTARILTRVFEHALDVPEGSITGLARHSVDVLRCINYVLPPGSTVSEDQRMGMGEHSDYGIVTILWADRVAGLQILGTEGRWHDVIPEPGALLVNLGDVMARLTNDQWLSTLHRVKPPVVNGVVQRRRAAAFFHDGDEDAVVQPLPGMVDAAHPPLYKPLKIGEHLLAKIGGSKGLVINTNDTEREAARVLASAR